MAIQIVANSNANAVELRGTNRGMFYNACLSAQLNLDDAERVDIINDIRTNAEGETVYEAYAVPFTELRDADNNAFATAQDAVNYITAECNQIVGSGVKVVGPTNELRFTLDQTHTTILLSDGSSFPVNAIKAVAGADGHIEIWEHGDNGIQLYDDLYVAFAYAAGSLVPQNLAGAVNTLNALFTVSPVGAGGGFTPIYPTLDGVAITPVAAGGQDPIGDNIYASTSSSQHGARYRSTEYIDAIGESFTFRMANHGQFLFGLGSVANGDVDEFDASSGNGHSGFFYAQAMYDYGAYMAPWTTYGSNSGLSYGPGWSFYGNDPMFRYSVAQQNMADGNDALFKVEIMDAGYVGCYYYDIDETNDWILLSRSTAPLPDGDYFLGIKLASTSGQLVEVPLRYATDDAAPTLAYRYIESPDGAFDFPLFATAEEAEWYDLNVASPAGSGQSQQVTYVDDAVTGQVWFRPVAGFTDDATSAPTSTSEQAYSEIPTQDDSLFAPSAPALQDYTVNENSAVNIQVAPQGILNYTVSVSGLPAGMTFDGATVVQGNAPEVADNNVNNPSDVYTITVTNSNAYGSASGTFDITVTNLTAPATSVAGTTWVSGTSTLVDSDTLDEGSAVTLDDTLADGQRFVVPQTWTETYVLPQLQAVGDEVFFGVQASGANLADGSDYSDFDMAIVWEYTSATSHTVNFIANGSRVDGVTVNSMTDAVYDFGFELNGTTGYIIYCNVGSINTEPSPADGGSFTFAESATGMTGPLTFTIATNLTTLDLDLTSFSEITTPTAPTGLTSWTKALDFSGGSEHAKQTLSHATLNPLRMNDFATNIAAPTTAGNTAYGASVRPWATAVMFQYDGNNSNQHIFNQGEGAGSVDDNIYLRIDSTGDLYFGWGRTGALNECHIASLGTTTNTSHWHGVYIAHTGERLSGTNATAANLADCFDIRFMGSNDTPSAFSTFSTNLSTAANWTAGSTGGRMDRSYTGDFTIGGRGGNRNFHGAIASMVVTTLRIGQPMPDATEIEMLLTDPVKWLDDYKIGQTYRRVDQPGDTSNFSLGIDAPARATQVWLMGEGTYDGYPTVRNQVKPTDSTVTSLTMQNMVSSDIVNVNIPGLT